MRCSVGIMMKYLFPIIIFSAFVFTPASYASVIFSCKTDDQKHIQVQDSGGKVVYKLGHDLTQPEFELSVDRSTASTWQWNGVGREMSYSVTIPDGDKEYTAFFSVDRVSDDHSITSGIIETTAQSREVSVYCNSDTLFQSLEGIDLKPQE